MAIALQGTPTLAESATGTTIAVTYPTGIVSGEVLLAHIADSSSTAGSTPPTGWTLALAQNGPSSSPSVTTYYRVADGTETGSVTFTGGGTSGRISGIMERWSGVDNTTPLDVTPVGANHTVSLSFPMASIATVTANTVLVHNIALNAASASDISPMPTGVTLVKDTTGTGRREVSAYESLASAGTGGGETWTCTGATTLQWAGITVALRPASGGSSFSTSASLTGSGALSAATTPSIPTTAALSGTGALSSSATVQASTSAALTGSGSLGSTGTPATSTTAALSGTGTLTAATTPSVPTAAALSGSGSLTGSGSGFSASPNLTGSGALTATAVPAFPLSVGLAGSGALTASAKPAITVSAALAGSGVLAASPKATVAVSAALTGSGALGATTRPAPAAKESLSGNGALAASSTPSVAGTVALSGSGALTVTTSLIPPHHDVIAGAPEPARWNGGAQPGPWAGGPEPSRWAGGIAPGPWSGSLEPSRWNGELLP